MDWFSAPDYWLSRLVFERGLALIYLLGFLSAARQFRALLGEQGLTPIPAYLKVVSFRRAPSIFQFHYSDRFFAGTSWTGVILSGAALLGLVDRAPLWMWMLFWAVLWLLYLSIVNVGQLWYSFGWESLLAEVGFLAIFLGPATLAPPSLVLLLLWWVLFRLEFGAGLIKIRHDPCWRNLTCLYYHHETQPMPNPLSWYFHHLPKPLHKVEVLANHVVQLVVPIGLFLPQPVARTAAVLIIVTQAWLMVSGNFAWLNALAIVLAFSAVDDALWSHILPVSPPEQLVASPTWYQITVMILTGVILALSYWPVRNMASRHQAMNASFTSLRLVNTYGAFGSITRIRHEVIIEGTSAVELTADTVWREYEFPGKPGDPRRRPPQVAPYHLRLGWLLWFAALSREYSRPWLMGFLRNLLRNDRDTLQLLRHNPFPESPPTHVRARYYRYRFTTWQERRESGRWWERVLVGEYVPPVRLASPGDAGAS